MAKHNYECNKCGRKFETEEGLNTHKEHCTTKKKKFLHRVFIIVMIIIFPIAVLATAGLFGFVFGLFDSSDSNYSYQESSINPEYERASQEWEGYRQLLNNDAQKLVEIGNKCIVAKNNEDLINCIGDGQARLNTYHSHLLQAKTFLAENSYLISNSLEIQQELDDQITYVVGTQYKFNIAINDYNAQQEAIRELLKAAALGI